MHQKLLKFLIKLLMFVNTCSSWKRHHREGMSLLIDFTCATAKDELEKHPEMQTIAMVELENNFPSDFSAKVLKCLPEDVAKIIINPHTHTTKKSILKFPKETLVIYIADKVDWAKTFVNLYFYFLKNFPVVSHLSKHLIVSSDETKINRTERIFKELLNVVQVYENNQKVIARSFDRTRSLTTSETFESSKRENLSQILFPDKTKNLNGQKIFTVWDNNDDAHPYKGSNRPNNKWIPYLDIIAEKLNGTLILTQIGPKGASWSEYWEKRDRLMVELIGRGKLDFYLNYDGGSFDLTSHNNRDWCFIAPLPKPYSIIELILFLPMDKSCWMWLGITIAVSTLVWRISEGHWNFAFGAFAYFMGQAQLSVRIRTNRLTMKILLQLLIFAIFIFSNGYQSLITSFMLNPMQQKLLKTVDEVLDSDLKIENAWSFRILYEDQPKYLKAKELGRIVPVSLLGDDWTDKMIEMDLASIQPCKLIKSRIENDGDGKSYLGIYIVNDVIYTLKEDFYIRPFHPLLEKFQEIMDRTLEVGLHQAWERFYWKILREMTEREKLDEHEEILDFSLIAPSLYILAFGLPTALVALLCEIFWKDFVMQLTKEYFERKRKEIFGRQIKIEKRKPKVRRNQVKPAVERRKRGMSI